MQETVRDVIAKEYLMTTAELEFDKEKRKLEEVVCMNHEFSTCYRLFTWFLYRQRQT